MSGAEDKRPAAQSTSLAVRGDIPRIWFCGAATVAAYALAALGPWDKSASIRISALLFLVPILAAVLGALAAGKMTTGKEHRMWRLMALSMSLFLAGMAYRAYYVFSFDRHPPAGSAEDVLYVLGFLVLVPIVLLLTQPFEAITLRKLRNMLDFATMLILVLAIAYLALFVPLEMIDPEGSLVSNLSLALYPVISVAFVLYLLAFRSRGPRSSAMILAGLSVAAVGVVGITVGIGWSLYQVGTTYAAVVDTLLAACFTLLAMSGFARRFEDQTTYRVATPEMDVPSWPGIVSFGIGLLGMPVLVYTATLSGDASAIGVISLCVAAVGVLIVARSAILTVENRRLADESFTDPLTGLFNHKYFRKRLQEEIAQARRAGDALTLAMIDIDSFSVFNRRYGYAAGDERMHLMAGMIQANVRDSDVVFRVGGDDFAILFPTTEPEAAYQDCLRIKMRAEDPGDGLAPLLKMSIGIAGMPAHATGGDELVRFAEGASYWAKSHGGDSIVIFDPHVVEALDSQEHLQAVVDASHASLVQSLAAAVDARDAYTRYHSQNVSQLVEPFCEELGLSPSHQSLLVSAALLHDVGKIGVPDSILTKQGSLDADEYTLIKEHPALGVRILGASTRQELLPWIGAHHEWWNGEGYPNSLAGEEIPLEARILSICDAFDAMTSDRPYRPGMPENEAGEEILRCAGTQFDADLARVFVGLIVDGKVRAQR